MCELKGNGNRMRTRLKIAAISIGTVLGVILLSIIILYLIGMAFVFDIGDCFIYRHSVSTKEEMQDMFYENQEEYEQLVSDAEEIRINSGEEFLLMSGKSDFKAYGLKSSVLKKFPIYMVTAKKENDEFEVSFDFKYAPNPYVYWGIYYRESGEPSAWGSGNLVEETDGLFIQELKGSYKYETEEIADNWYYYQCWTR